MRWYIMGAFFNPKGMRNHSKCPSAQTNADTLRALKVYRECPEATCSV
ncbi:hypothetical protein Pcac1_g25349 [Phytophthora cactorum]|nr:hypothetical protein Pcac1_g25349 [Phytophthora cactorum]